MKLFAEAVRLHQHGQQHEARELCQKILQRDPGNAQVLALHGTVNALLGQRDEAIVSFERAAARQPRHAPVHYMLGNLYREAGKLDKAIVSYRKAVFCQPDFAEAFNNMGLTLGELGRHDEELQCYQKSMTLNPRNPAAWFNLGNALQLLEKFDDAMTCYEQVLQLDAGNVSAWFNMGNARLAAGQLSSAIAGYQQVLALSPDHAGAMGNLGVALRRAGQLQDAERVLGRVIELQPDNVPALVSLGNVQAELNSTTQAIETFKRATAIAPEYADAWFNLGNLLHREKRYAEAVSMLEAACRLQPTNVQYLGSLTGCQMALWQMSRADQTWLQLLASESAAHTIPMDVVLERSNDLPLIQGYAARHVAQILRDCDPQWLQPKLADAELREPARYRIGYLSPDFGEHPVGMSLVEVLERHDHTQFEIIAIALSDHPPGTTRDRIVAACDHYVSLQGVPQQQAIEVLRQLELDLLIDLVGYTAGSRPQLLAARPARVQAAYLGYAATTAAPWIDYLIADAYVVPPAAAAHYSEHIAWLDTCFFPSDTTQAVPQSTTDRAQEGLPEDAVVLCCFNNVRRISLQMMQTWLGVLAAVEGSVLWLGSASKPVSDIMREFAAQHGVDPQRLIFAGFAATRQQHLARHRLADLYLDTFPYNSHSTARDALYAGVPLVTLSGEAFASRVAGSLLTALGLPELITCTIDDYKRTVIEFASSPDRLRGVRDQLAVANATRLLFRSDVLSTNLERAYAAMIARQRAGNDPGSFMLAADTTRWI